MFVTIRRYRHCAGPDGEVARRARDSLLPVLREQPGLRLYCAFQSEDGDIYALNVVDDARQAVTTNARVLEWVAAKAYDLLPYPPRIMMGTCAVSASRQTPFGGDGCYVTVRMHYELGPEDQVMRLVRDHVQPLLARSPGFLAFYAFMNTQRSGQGIGVTLFETRAAADSANERAVATMLQRGIAPYPPTVAAGEAFLLEMAGGAQAAAAACPDMPN